MRVLSSRIHAPIYQGIPTNRIPIQVSDQLRGEDGGDTLRFELLSPGTRSICVSEQQRAVNVWRAGQMVRIEFLTDPRPSESHFVLGSRNFTLPTEAPVMRARPYGAVGRQTGIPGPAAFAATFQSCSTRPKQFEPLCPAAHHATVVG